MQATEVQDPIINSPYEEPSVHWRIHENEPAEKVEGRRLPTYMYLPPGARPNDKNDSEVGYQIELQLVSLVRERLVEWRPEALKGGGGVSRVTMELLRHWRRDGRKEPLFFAQLEAAETIIFLTEGRADFLQGIKIPLDEPGEEKLNDGFTAFERRCCRMATGSGKTMVMGMLTAWSILNRTSNPQDIRFSDAVLVVCPNVTIRGRLAELDPQRGEASIYRTRDLVPSSMMPQLAKGRVKILNWHQFEPQSSQSGGKVVKVGRHLQIPETMWIGPETQTLRGRKYITEDDFQRNRALGLLHVCKEERDKKGNLVKVEVLSDKYVESDAALVRRLLNRELGTRRNILVLNDEAHHAYRLRTEDEGGDPMGEGEATERYYKEATVWVDGLDRINKQRHINFCVDFSATPYFLGKAGSDTNRIFPWTVSSFDLQDAIEAGLVKIPQLAARDSSGDSVPGYFNIWKWILPHLTASERGGGKGDVKPEAVLKYAHTPIAMLGGMWEELRQDRAQSDDRRPPVFIIVCKTRKLAQVVYEWLADDHPPNAAIPSAHLPSLCNKENKTVTICVYSDVQDDIDSGNAKNDENLWMRYTLDTVGKLDWPRDRQGRMLYPEGFEALAKKMDRSLHPPGRDVRCIVSVGMLTEGWDCNTVTHIIGLRPFQSQLLCEQVIGRGLRRISYQVNDNGLMNEEIATVLGVPLSAFTVKVIGNTPPQKRTLHHIYAVPEKESYRIRFPRVEGYRQIVNSGVTCNLQELPSLKIDTQNIPTEVELKAGLPENTGRLSLHGPGKVNEATLEKFRRQMRLQERVIKMTAVLTQKYADETQPRLPRGILFCQLLRIVQAYIYNKVIADKPADIRDAFLSPYYGLIIERLQQGIRPSNNDEYELPRYERMRGEGSTDEVDFFTARTPYPVIKSHVNAVVPDTARLEQAAAQRLDTHPRVLAFVKNEGLGFGIPYFHNGEAHEYMPDFLVRLGDGNHRLILETKGFDPLKEIKKSAALRWVAAVNMDGKHGRWIYKMVSEIDEIDAALDQIDLDFILTEPADDQRAGSA